MLKKIKGFSLIELSIVILIIGILIAGVTQGSRLVSQMKLSTARSVTQSSPVASIRGLTVWFDATSSKSFGTSELDDGAPVTDWYSLNPQTISSFITTQATTTRQPKFIASGINGLPVVEFDGGDCLQRANTTGNEVFSTREVTLYMVQKHSAASAGVISNVGFFANNATATLYRLTLALPHSDGVVYADFNTGGCCPSRVNAAPANFFRVAHIISAYRQQDSTGGTNDTMTLRMDSTNLASDSDNASPLPSSTVDNFSIGCWAAGAADSYTGQIGELIFFDRYLKQEERTSVEQYLGKKWGIKI